MVAFAPVVLLLVGVAVWSRRRDVRVWLLVAMFAVVVVGYFFWWGVSNSYHFQLDRSLGPFYYYPVLAPLCVLAAWGAVLLRRSRALGAAIVIAGLAWAAVASTSVVRAARHDGETRTTEVDALRVPARSLVVDAPLFPNDPYLRVATDATLRRPNLVAVDVPDRRLELLDRFPDRTAYLVLAFHRLRRLPRPGAAAARRPAASCAATRSSRACTSASRPDAPGACTCGSATPRRSGRARAAATSTRRCGWLRPRSRPRGASTEIAVGVAVGEPGGAAPDSLAGNWFECRTEARSTAVGSVEVLQLCDGRHHYLFPNGRDATAVEDVAPALQVALATR